MKKILIGIIVIALAFLAYRVFTEQGKQKNPENAPEYTDSSLMEENEDSEESTVVGPEIILGTWKSEVDEKSTRTYQDDGIVIDAYDGKEIARGTWEMFSKEQPLESVSLTLEEETVYMQEVMTSIMGIITHNYRVDTITPESMELTYMDEAGTLVFKRI